MPTLFATAMLWLVLMYSFAMVGHAYLSDEFPENECDTMWSCVLFTLNFGMRSGGGIGDVLRGGGDGASRGAGRMIYDLSFFVAIPVIMLSIVSAIIVDAFGASRATAGRRWRRAKPTTASCVPSTAPALNDTGRAGPAALAEYPADLVTTSSTSTTCGTTCI